jgi:hypothetical protein
MLMWIKPTDQGDPIDGGAGDAEPLGDLGRAESFGHQRGDFGSPDRTRPPFADALRLRGGYAFKLTPRSGRARHERVGAPFRHIRSATLNKSQPRAARPAAQKSMTELTVTPFPCFLHNTCEP